MKINHSVNCSRKISINPLARPLAGLLLVLFCLLAAGHGWAQEYLVKDINNQVQSTGGSTPMFFVSLGSDIFYFRANDGINGNELWKSDGTPEGTMLVANISPAANSDPALLINAGGTLYFTATDSSHGRELWKSDGTAAGTVMVKDIFAGSSTSIPANFVVVNGILFFTANNGSSGVELWKTDGTEAGTTMVRDILPGGGFSTPQNLVNFQNTLFFSANGGTTSGAELWKSDGTSAGTVLVKDIFPGGVGSFPQGLTVIGNTLFFSANGGTTTTGVELWKTDGTTAGTVIVKDILPGSSSSGPQNLVDVNGTLFFSATGPVGGSNSTELWKSDGTESGTVLVKDINPGASSFPLNLVSAGGLLYFAATTAAEGRELWQSDGTDAGTFLVQDIQPGSASSSPSVLMDVNGTVFFVASNNVVGVELWRTAFTNGVALVKDIRPGPLSSFPQGLANINGALIFSADDGFIGRELWKSDGTEEGTVLISNIRPDSTGNSSPVNMAAFDDRLYFAANNGLDGLELFTSDGTSDGTMPLRSAAGAPILNPQRLTVSGDHLFFIVNAPFSGRLWKTDGTQAGTVPLVFSQFTQPATNPAPIQLEDVNGTLFFSGLDAAKGRELCKTDGTDEGTVMVKDINPNGSSLPANLLNVNGTLYFTAISGPSPVGNIPVLWKSDGTEAGTVSVQDLTASNLVARFPGNLVHMNGTLFFTASDISGHGTELWKSDGTLEGTFMVKDINPGGFSSAPTSLTVMGEKLFFAADRGTGGRELWESDGTEAGTVLLADILPGFGGSNPGTFQVISNGLFVFSANDGAHGIELWASDGFSVWLAADINPGPANSAPQNLAVADGAVYFSATDGINGRELWKSGGFPFTTSLAADITQDSMDSNPGALTLVGATLYFAADTAPFGRELFGYVLNHPPTVAGGIPDQTGVYGESFSFTIPLDAFDDEDFGQLLTYTAADLPPGVTFDGETFSGTLSAAGEFLVTVTATDNGFVPLSATTSFLITVEKATPVISWTNPAAIIYGTPLSGSQLNATADTAGTFVYSPPAGTVLHAGPGQPLSVSFIPADTANYNEAGASVAITVLKVPLTATAASQSRTYGAANPPLTILYTGFVNGDTAAVLDVLPVAATAATAASSVGTYPITLSGGSDNNYSFTFVNGTLTVTPALLTVTANDASRVYGEPNPAFTGSLSGIQNGDPITATYASAATASSLAGTYPIVPTLVDPDGKLGNYTVVANNGTLTITPAALTVTITAPASGFVQSIDTNILFTGSFTKSGASDSYLASWTFTTDSSSETVAGTVSNNTVTCEVQFSAAGVYSVALTVTNESGPSATATTVNHDLPAYVVIFDPEGGFVTGGGWINSPAGAYLLEPDLTGRATFGFVSRYQNGASVPTGQTQFKFQAADFDFRSTTYEWMVIAGAKAQYKGSGTINGEGDYGFMLTARDGDANGGGGVDRFRIKIWEKEHGVIIYDNQRGAADNDEPATVIQGSIVIHKD